VWSAKYNSFGKATVDPSSTVANPLRFPGQYEDTETGLHYNAYRYYDTNIGKYLRVDSLRLSQLAILIQISFNKILRSFPIGFYENLEQLLIVVFIYQYGLSAPQLQNVYSYVRNNSLNLTDPTGELINVGFGIVGGLIGGITNGVYAYGKPGGSFWKGFAIGAVGGFVGGFTMNPVLGGAITGAMTGYGNVKFGIDCGDPLKAAGIGALVGGTGGYFSKLAGIAVLARSGGAPEALASGIGKAAGGIFAGSVGGIAGGNFSQ
jgi:RHS repeat-associated protein